MRLVPSGAQPRGSRSFVMLSGQSFPWPRVRAEIVETTGTGQCGHGGFGRVPVEVRKIENEKARRRRVAVLVGGEVRRINPKRDYGWRSSTGAPGFSDSLTGSDSTKNLLNTKLCKLFGGTAR